MKSQLSFEWTVETGPIHEAFEFAKDFFRVYVNRGEFDGHNRICYKGFGQRDGPSLQTSGFFRGHQLKPNQVAVELLDGSLFIFSLSEICRAIKEE